MKLKIEKKILILIAIGIIFTFSLINDNTPQINLDTSKLKTSIVSSKIFINETSDWVDLKNAENITGQGTFPDPYVIEDLVIDCLGSGDGIRIENTEVFFIIENCTILNTGVGWEDSAIKLVSVKNGIINNTEFTNGAWGIFLFNSDNSTIVGNTFTSSRGINLEYSNLNTIYLNNLKTGTMNVFTLTSTSDNNLWNSPEQLKYTYKNRSFSSYLGNFWSDYSEDDADANGVADGPVIFYDSTRKTIDYYPLMEETENYEIGKYTEVPGGEAIPGYDLLFLIGMISIASLILLNMVKKSFK